MGWLGAILGLGFCIIGIFATALNDAGAPVYLIGGFIIVELADIETNTRK